MTSPGAGAGAHARSFPPIVDARSRVLVLGSMPGRASLDAAQYYAHPRNLFWPFMDALLAVDADGSYEARTSALLASHVALWDVLASCDREGSLDSDIDPATALPNALPELLVEHPSIHTLCFNGAAAAKLFDRLVAARLPEDRAITLHRLPSTSPANASIPREKKLAAWRVVSAAARTA